MLIRWEEHGEIDLPMHMELHVRPFSEFPSKPLNLKRVPTTCYQDVIWRRSEKKQLLLHILLILRRPRLHNSGT